MQSVLEQISEGMKIYDSHQKEIGKVEYVKLVETDPATGQPEAAGLEEVEGRRPSLLDNIADAFRDDDLPEVVRERLLHNGFIRKDADGLFAADRYVLPDQIASVAGDRVNLKVSKDDLVKRH